MTSKTHVRALSIVVVLLMSLTSGGCRNRIVKLKLVDSDPGRAVVTDYSSSTLHDIGQREATYPLRYDAVYVPDERIRNAGLAKYYRFYPNGRFTYGSLPPGRRIDSTLTDEFSTVGGSRYYVRGVVLQLEDVLIPEQWPRPFVLFRLNEAEMHSDGSFTMLELANLPGGVRDVVAPVRYYPLVVGPKYREPDW
jgi:hypothetical protein